MCSACLPMAYMRELTCVSPSSLCNFVARRNRPNRSRHSGHVAGWSKRKFSGGLNLDIFCPTWHALQTLSSTNTTAAMTTNTPSTDWQTRRRWQLDIWGRNLIKPPLLPCDDTNTKMASGSTTTCISVYLWHRTIIYLVNLWWQTKYLI